MANTLRLAAQARRQIAHIAAGCLTLAMCAGIATVARAQCTVAGLTNSADASTTQALETIRDRRMQVAQSCPAGTMASATGMCVPMAGAMAPTGAQAAPKAAPKAAAKAAPKAAPQPSFAAPAPAGRYASLKDDYVEPSRARSYGVWAEGYGDYERRSDVEGDDGSSQTVKTTSWGVVSGIDHTHLRSPREGVIVGVLAGYNDTHVRYSGDAGAGIPPRSQDIDGAMLGLYSSYFHRGFAIDVLAKVDIFDFDQRVTSGCPDTQATEGSTSLTNYLIASNIYLRHGHGHLWFEPTAGIRYIHSDFGSRATALGVADGEALRLQAGVRVGSDWVGHDRRLWSVSFLAALYSDVLVDGFTATGADTVLEDDEGKVRALGQLRIKATTAHGVSYYGQAEVRGGEDYFGVGGKVGLRYDW
jgi:outer membrane autotransporter protein